LNESPLHSTDLGNKKTKRMRAGTGGGVRDLTPKVGEKPALDLEYAGDGFFDKPLRPLREAFTLEGAETAAAGPVAQPMVGDRRELEYMPAMGFSTHSCGGKGSSWSQD
jgi:hypothetical protein